MNVLTQKKINAIKEKIKNKVELKEIIKVHFGGSRPRLEQWLKEKFSSDFSQEELDYLEYVIIPVDVTDEEVKPFKEVEKIEIEEVEEVPQNTIATIPTINQISLMSRKDRENFLLSNTVIEKLVDLLTNNVKIAEKDEIVITDEVRDLKDLKIQNIRISEQIYKDFTNLCKKKGLTITSVINIMFLDFIKKHS
jgi:hypothetical protein